MSTTERDDAPWTWTGDRFANHYADDYGPGGRAPEHMEHAAARDWAENGNPKDGDRWGEFFIQDGQLWNDGKYGAADGSPEPYEVWRPSSADADACAACADARAAVEAGDPGDAGDETAGSSVDEHVAVTCDEDGQF